MKNECSVTVGGSTAFSGDVCAKQRKIVISQLKFLHRRVF